METRHIFLDTEVFHRANFQYRSGPLKTLLNLARDGDVIIHLTDITVEEVKNHIAEGVTEASRVIASARKSGKILRNSKHPLAVRLFEPFDPEEIVAELLTQFERFVKEAEVDVITTANASITAVFSRYFNCEPPFGEGKKKHEFPDAFVLATLEHWCECNKKHVYVVSDDRDMQSACEQNEALIGIDNVSTLLAFIAPEKIKTSLAYDFLHSQLKIIEQQVLDLFTLLGFWLEDNPGDVEQVTVEGVNLLEKYLWDIDSTLYENREAITFKLIYRIDFLADIIYEDRSLAIYDKEDDEYYMIKRVATQVKDTTDLPVMVQIALDEEKPQNSELVFVFVDPSSDIEISIGEQQLGFL